LPERKIRMANVFIRKDVARLTDNEMTSLRKGFRVLRQRSANNPNSPLGWLGQANIHRDRCAHANWWFLPWHRAYLYYFERILREAAEDDSLALPYWDWTGHRGLPDRFFGADNPLNDDTRRIGSRARADAGFVGPGVIRDIVQTTNFFTFAGGSSAGPRIENGSGNLEFQPHNYIHRFVGGNMGFPETAARDPIFWLHHANVDRLWTRWVRKNPGRTTTNQNWRQEDFRFFSRQGNQVTITTAEVLRTFDLDYRYDTQRRAAIEVGRAMAPEEFGPEEEPRGESLFQAAAPEHSVISSEPTTVTLVPSDQFQEGGERMVMAEDVAQEATTLRLEVQGVTPPDDPDVGVRIFLNMPDADASTPTDDPHYVASFTFFEHEGEGDHGGHEHGPKTYYINATPAIRRLQEAGEYSMGDQLQTTLVTVPIIPEGSVEDVEIPYEGLSISAHD
jgi:tyrosinase